MRVQCQGCNMYLVRLLKRHQSRKLEKNKRRRNHREWFGAISLVPGMWYPLHWYLPLSLSRKEMMLQWSSPRKCSASVSLTAPLYSGLSAYFITMSARDHEEQSPGSAAHDSGRRKRKYTSGGFPQATISSVPHITHSCFPLLAVIVHHPFSCSFVGRDGKL